MLGVAYAVVGANVHRRVPELRSLRPLLPDFEVTLVDGGIAVSRRTTDQCMEGDHGTPARRAQAPIR